MRSLPPLIGTALALAAALVIAGCREEAKPDFEGSPSDSALLPEPVGQLDEWQGVERSGREISTAELGGRFAVVDFIFTRCGGPCPAMSRAMSELQTALDGAEDVVLASFTVDPKNDTPEILRHYADSYAANDDWLFLRFSVNHVKTITGDLLLGDGGDPIMHSSKFVLLDKESRVRAYYDPLTDVSWMKKLLGDLETLRRGGGG